MSKIEISVSEETMKKIMVGKATAFATKTKQGTRMDWFFVSGERYDIESVMRVRGIIAVDCFWKELGAKSHEQLLNEMKELGTILYFCLNRSHYYLHFFTKH